jgi:hypothetical protein
MPLKLEEKASIQTSPRYEIIGQCVKFVSNKSLALSFRLPYQSLLLIMLNPIAWEHAVSKLPDKQKQALLQQRPQYEKLSGNSALKEIAKNIHSCLMNEDTPKGYLVPLIRSFFTEATQFLSKKSLSLDPKLSVSPHLEKANDIAKSLAYYYYSSQPIDALLLDAYPLELSSRVVWHVFRKHYSDVEIKKLKKDFFDDISQAIIDGAYPLLALLPHRRFIQECLSHLPYLVVDIKAQIYIQRCDTPFVLSLLSSSQALLLFMLNRPAYEAVSLNLDGERTELHFDQNLVMQEKLIAAVDSIHLNLYQAHVEHGSLIYPLRYFYAAVKAVASGGNLPQSFVQQRLPEPTEISTEKWLRLSDAQKAQHIANTLAYRYFQKFSLSRADVINAFKQYLKDPKQIPNLNKYFLDEVTLARIDHGRYSLLAILPHPYFIHEVLAAFDWKQKHASNPLKEVIFRLSICLERFSYQDPRYQCVKKLIADVERIQKSYPQDTDLLTAALTQTCHLLLNHTTNSFDKTLTAIQRKSWGKIIVGSLLFIAGLAVIGLCCASGLGLAIPYLAFSLSLYHLAAGAGIGLVAQVAGISLFNKGTSLRGLAQDMKEVSRSLTEINSLEAGKSLVKG